jgi:hypothetical protein
MGRSRSCGGGGTVVGVIGVPGWTVRSLMRRFVLSYQ